MGAAPLKWLEKIGGAVLKTKDKTLSGAVNDLDSQLAGLSFYMQDGYVYCTDGTTTKKLGDVSGLGLTAEASQVLSGKTFLGKDSSNADELSIISGTIPTRSNGTSVDSMGKDSTGVWSYIPSGYYPEYSGKPGYSYVYHGTLVGSATQAQVLKDKTFTSTAGVNIKGTMANNGAWTPTNINPSGSVTVPAGYHNGSGKVTANANQNSATYTYASGSTGGKVDMGVNNTYRYVNAANVYAKGKADGDVKHNVQVKVVKLSGGTISDERQGGVKIRTDIYVDGTVKANFTSEHYLSGASSTTSGNTTQSSVISV